MTLHFVEAPHRNPWSNQQTNLAGGTRHRYDHHSRDSLSRVTTSQLRKVATIFFNVPSGNLIS